MHTAEDYIRELALELHVEGGYFRELLLARQTVPHGEEAARPLYSSILFLLREGEVSHLHRLTVDEIWYFHDGAPLSIHVLSPGGEHAVRTLGRDAARGEALQVLVPAGSWFGAEMENAGFALVGCLCAPAFSYGDFELMTQARLAELFPQHAGRLFRLAIP